MYSNEEILEKVKANPELQDLFNVLDGACPTSAEMFDLLEAKITGEGTLLAIKVHSEKYRAAKSSRPPFNYFYEEYWANVIGHDGLNRLEIIHETTGPRYLEHFFKPFVYSIDPEAEIERIGKVENFGGILGRTRPSSHYPDALVLSEVEARQLFADFLNRPVAQDAAVTQQLKDEYAELVADFGKALVQLSHDTDRNKKPRL